MTKKLTEEVASWKYCYNQIIFVSAIKINGSDCEVTENSFTMVILPLSPM